MGIGDLKLSGCGLRSRLSLSKWKGPAPDANQPDQPRYRSIDSIVLPTSHGPVQPPVERAKRGRKWTGARHMPTKSLNDAHHPPTKPEVVHHDQQRLGPAPGRPPRPLARGAPATPRSSTLRLDKPLPPLPDLPNARPPPPPPPPPRPPESPRSATNTASASAASAASSSSSDEEARRRAPAGAPAHRPASAASGRTVTPMSSVESARALGGRGLLCAGAGGPGAAAARSAPETPGPAPAPAPSACLRCGRDCAGGDAGRGAGGRPGAVSGAAAGLRGGEADPGRAGARGPAVVACDDRGRRYALYPQTSYFRPWEEPAEAQERRPPTPPGTGRGVSVCRPPARPHPADTAVPAPGERPQQRPRAAFEVGPLPPDAPSGVGLSFSDRISQSEPHDRPLHPYEAEIGSGDGQLHEGERAPHSRSFWKNADGVILVYQGIDIGGKETYYGSDINYLGSFRDDDEGSSGLGSSRGSLYSRSGSGDGLAMISEVGASGELWAGETLQPQ